MSRSVATVEFSVNVSMLYAEAPFLERFACAAAAGFGAVEFWWPREEDPGEVAFAVRDAGLRTVVLNFDAGDMAAGDRGLLSDPDRQATFRENVPVALDLAAALDCRRLNALVGVRLAEHPPEDQLALAVENVRFAADRAARQGADVLIEAVNTFENGPYLIARTADAADFIRRVDRPNVRLQYDAYHMQRMEGDLAANLRRHIADIAHVQIADSPDRHEPGTGELNFRYLLGVLGELGYDGYIGLEYKPRADTERGLEWLPREQRSGRIDPAAALPATREAVA